MRVTVCKGAPENPSCFLVCVVKVRQMGREGRRKAGSSALENYTAPVAEKAR